MLSLQLTPPTQASPAFFPVAPSAQLVVSTPVPTQPLPWELASLIQLNFSELQSFEVVHDQYRQWGLEFEQAIALEPSNSAFNDDPEQPVGLMPIAHPFMAIQFHPPRQVVKAKLVGARAIIVTAFDVENRVIARCDLGQSAPEPNSSEQNESEAAFKHTIPLHALHLQAAAIARIEITSAAPFMLQRFCCI